MIHTRYTLLDETPQALFLPIRLRIKEKKLDEPRAGEGGGGAPDRVVLGAVEL